jgi:hypothetical protein
MENSHKGYTGLEVNFIELIFKRLNLTAEYNVSPNTKGFHYRMFMQTVGQLETSSSDISIGGLPLQSDIIQVAEASVPYVYTTVPWYVPCPKLAARWKSIYKIFCSLVWA